MEAAIIMLVLTMLDDGQMSGAFVATEGPSNCEQRAKVVRRILSGASIEIRRIACLEGKVSFEKFSHKTPENAPRYHYLVRHDGKSVEILAASNMAACLEALQARGAGAGQAHCVSSSQKPTGR